MTLCGEYQTDERGDGKTPASLVICLIFVKKYIRFSVKLICNLQRSIYMTHSKFIVSVYIDTHSFLL